MLKIIFICHGNICRSPMALFIFNSLFKDNNIKAISRATSYEEIGNDIYPPAKRIMDKYNIKYSKHCATRISDKEYQEADYIFAMDKNNINNLKLRFNDISKVYLLNAPYEVDDPWYTGDFETAYKQIKEGCFKAYNLIFEKHM